MRCRKRTYLALLCATIGLGFSLPSCAPIMAALPQVVAVITDAMATLTVIDQAVEQWLDAHPNVDPAKRAKYREAYTRCVSALNAANHALAGVEKLDQSQVDVAFAEFKTAYYALRDLLVIEGVARADTQGRLTVGTDAVLLPEPEALTFRLGE